MPRLRTGGAIPGDAYQRLNLNVNDVVDTHTTLLNARRDYIAAGDRVTADRLAVIFDVFVTRIKAIALKTAEIAEQEITALIDSTRVRPDTGRAGPKLRDLIQAEAWDPTADVATGAVAIGLHAVLDQVPYWRVQEYGHHFAHTPKGFFAGPGYKGFSMPDPALFRVHPLFVPSGKGRKFRKPPVVQPRHFLRDGTAKAVAYWQTETRAAITATGAQLGRLLAERGRTPVARVTRRRP